MVRYVVRNRELLENAILAHVLPFVAGAVNASGFFIVGVYTSHVTGSVARVGDELAQGKTRSALAAMLLVLAFFAGALVATALTETARHARRARYAPALLAEVATLLLVTLLGLTQPRGVPLLHVYTTTLLCFAMGAQNALVTKLSGAVVRTTHLTGIVTDLGIEVVRLARWLRRTTRGQHGLRRLGHVWRVRRHPELARLRLHGGIFGSFLAGAIAGPWLYLHHGHLSMLLPVGVLSALVVFDSMFGLRPWRRPAEPSPLPAAAASLPESPPPSSPP